MCGYREKIANVQVPNNGGMLLYMCMQEWVQMCKYQIGPKKVSMT